MIIRVLIIDDHPAMAIGVTNLLQKDSSIQIVGIAENSAEGFKLIKQLQPSIILLDLNMPDETGIQVCAKIKERYPAIHIIIHTAYDYIPYFNQLLESGASGMLNKTASSDEIISIIHAVVRGQTMIPLTLYRQIKLHRSAEVKHYWEMDLTPTERAILNLVSNKYTNPIIARKMHISVSSVEKYLRRIYEKLGVRSKNEAIERIKNDERFELVDTD